jgi:hypothetical protein
MTERKMTPEKAQLLYEAGGHLVLDITRVLDAWREDIQRGNEYKAQRDALVPFVSHKWLTDRNANPTADDLIAVSAALKAYDTEYGGE